MFWTEQTFDERKFSYRQPRLNFMGLAAARLWLVLALLISGGFALDTGVGAQRQLAHAEDAGALPASRPVLAGNIPLSAGAANHTKADKPVTSSNVLPTKQANVTAEPIAPSTETKAAPSFLAYSEPTGISLPTVGIQSSMISVGKTATGEMEVPEHPNFDKAAWYRDSPTPGQFGASIIVGHVDSYANNGASVFYSLPKVKVGDPVVINRADGSTVTFIVRALRNYAKASMPEDIIFAPVTEDAELRLITCSGRFIQETGNYDSNTVVFATMKH